MATTVRLIEQEFTIRDGEWTGPEGMALNVLRSMTATPELGYYPDPDHGEAMRAVRAFGAEVVASDPPEKHEDGVIY
jgi:hypothetical protein